MVLMLNNHAYTILRNNKIVSLFDEKTAEQHVRDLDKIVRWNLYKRIRYRVHRLFRREATTSIREHNNDSVD